ncbi:outer membrane protein assembly factor BamB [Marinagarivorans algicola]|uniref:outer membrane protein assembly factor BamB n=1 Tax=Marinagarivorans algicola TaxID=1513270 RepID=UPI0006B57394|nr:outer membrane protein assembly factor BamB [Marinagarivorans algicola]
MPDLCCLARKLKILACFVFLPTVLLAGCAAKDAALVPAELVAFESTAHIKTAWHSSLDGNARSTGIGPFKSGRVYSRPLFGGGNYERFYLALQDDTLFAVTKKGRVFAVNKKNGKRLWRVDLKREISAGISLQGNTLFVATIKGQVLALSADDGKVLWTAQATTEVIAPPQSNGREVLVSAIDGRLFAFNADTGEKLWNYDHPQPLLTFRSQASPLLVGRQAFIAFDNGQLLSFGTRNGDLKWATRVSQPQGITELERAVDLDVTPVADGPFIYAAGANGRIVAVTKGTGKISWAEDASIFNELSLNDDAVFYVDENSHVFSRRLSSGTKTWESDVLHRRGVGSPSVVGEFLAMIDSYNMLQVLDAQTGKLAARRPLLGNGYASPLLVDGDTIYTLSNNGSLSAYRIIAKK